MCLRYAVGKRVLDVFTNFDMSRDVGSSQSMLRCMMTYAGGAVSWQSRLQKSVALSITDTEYMAAVEAKNDLIWMRNFLSEMGLKQREF